MPKDLFGRWVHHSVSPLLCGKRATTRREVTGDHGSDSARAKRRDHGEADRTAADDDDRLLTGEPSLVDRMQPDRHGFGQSGKLRGRPGRHALYQRLGQQHVLGEATWTLFAVPEADDLIADEGRNRTHKIAGADRALGLGAEVNNLRAELVSKNNRIQRGEFERASTLAARLDERLGVLNGM